MTMLLRPYFGFVIVFLLQCLITLSFPKVAWSLDVVENAIVIKEETATSNSRNGIFTKLQRLLLQSRPKTIRAEKPKHGKKSTSILERYGTVGTTSGGGNNHVFVDENGNSNHSPEKLLADNQQNFKAAPEVPIMGMSQSKSKSKTAKSSSKMGMSKSKSKSKSKSSKSSSKMGMSESKRKSRMMSPTAAAGQRMKMPPTRSQSSNLRASRSNAAVLDPSMSHLIASRSYAAKLQSSKSFDEQFSGPGSVVTKGDTLAPEEKARIDALFDGGKELDSSSSSKSTSNNNSNNKDEEEEEHPSSSGTTSTKSAPEQSYKAYKDEILHDHGISTNTTSLPPEALLEEKEKQEQEEIAAEELLEVEKQNDQEKSSKDEIQQR